MLMRVEEIRAYPLRIKAEEKLKGGTFSYEYYQSVVIRAVCDGVEGWGEAMTRFSPRATSLLVDYIGAKLKGRKFESPLEAWKEVWRELRIRGHTRGTDVEALSGIEIALYDCLGRMKKMRLCEMLSGSAAKTVPAFAGSLFVSRGKTERQVEVARASGLVGAKVKIGFGAEKDRKIISEVRAKWPEAMLVADANGAYGVREAERACAMFKDLDLAWFEEPLLSDDWAGYVRLGKQKSVRIGAGESWFAGDLAAALEAGLVDVVEPSVSRCGGVGVEFQTGKLAAKRKVRFAPMTGMNSAISLAASLHIAAAVPTVGVEYNPFRNPLQEDLATGIPEPSDGSIAPPGGYGLGVEVDRDFVRKNSTQHDA